MGIYFKKKYLFYIIVSFIIIMSGCKNSSNGNILYPTISENQEDSESTANNNINSAIISSEPYTQENQEKNIFYGKWKISKEIAYSKVYSEEESRGMIGKKIEFGKDCMIYNDEKNEIENYIVNDISKSEFEESERTLLDDLGIQGDTITQVEIQIRLSNGNLAIDGYFYIKDEEHLIYPVGGVFFEMTRLD